MALQYDQNYDNPTLDINLPEALTAQNIDAVTQPVANQNGSGGFSFGNAIKGVLDLLDNGIEIYNKVNTVIDGASAKNNANDQKVAPVTVSSNNPSFILGLSTNQLLLIAGGLAAVLILPRLLRNN
jgi:hypothetical protein